MVLRIAFLAMCLPTLALAYTDFDAAIWVDSEGVTKEGSLVIADNRFGDTPIFDQMVELTSLSWDDMYGIAGGNPWSEIEYYSMSHVILDGIDWSIGQITYTRGSSAYPKFGPITAWETVEKDEWGLPVQFGDIEGGVGPGLIWGNIVGGQHFHSPATALIGGVEFVDSDPGQNIFGPIPEPGTMAILLVGLPVLFRRWK